MAAHSSIPCGIIPWTEEPGRLQAMGSQRHNWATEHIHVNYISLKKDADNVCKFKHQNKDKDNLKKNVEQKLTW